MKTTFFTITVSLLFVTVYSNAQGRPQLTSDQRSCLEAEIGPRGSGNHPTPHKMRAAFESCGIQAPGHGSSGGLSGGLGPQGQGHGGNLTTNQRTCIKGEVGTSGRGNKPSRKQMKAAFDTCGVQFPRHGSIGRDGGTFEPKRHGRDLTADQRTCLAGEVGTPGSGNRPSRKQMKAAFDTCGVQPPRHGPGMGLTEDQRFCMESKLGAPGEGGRHSKIQIGDALSDCGIERPARPETVVDFESLKQIYILADPDEKNDIRESMRKIFYESDDEKLKKQVLNFFRNNPQTVDWSSPAYESGTGAQ